MHSIFISYRRSDSEGEAGRLCDDLVSRFTERSVFMDVDAIAPGRDFRQAIVESIHACTVLLAVIGPGWLDCLNDLGERRLDDDGDFVRIEIAAALKRNIPVVPILIRGSRMPRADQLPEALRELAFRNAVELTHSRWKSDIQLLVQALQPYTGAIQAPAAPAYAAAAPLQPASASLPNELLEQVTRDLAHYIGPIAAFVVKRAARTCGSVSELKNAVAGEIPSPADRTVFLSRKS